MTGIVIGRLSRGPETPDQVFLNNAAPGTPTPSAPLAEPRESRAPLGTVVRPTPTVRRQQARPTTRPTKPSRKNTIEGAYDAGDNVTTHGPDLGEDGTDGVGVLSAIEAEVVRLTNAARRKAGCQPLRVDHRLVSSARAHSRDMAATGRLSHSSPDGTSPWHRMEQAGYLHGGAENIGRGYQDAIDAVRGWMRSPSHRKNILNCDLRATGVGVAQGDGGPWWTQDFGYS